MGLSCGDRRETYNLVMANHTPPPRTDTRRQFTKAAYLTDDQIDQILADIEEGFPVDIACQQSDTSATQFKRRRHNDPELTARFEEAVEIGHPAQQEKLRAEWWRQIFEDRNWKALHAAIITRLPEGASLRTSRLEVGNVPGEKLEILHQRRFPDMSLEELEAQIKILELEKARSDPNLIELPMRASGA